MASESHKAYSMTGYGKGEARLGGVRCSIEVRSTNHRYRDVNIRLPRAVASYDERLRQLVHARLSRGKVDVFVAYEDEAAQSARVRVNAALAASVVEAARGLCIELGIENDVSASDLLRLPEVFTFDAADGIFAGDAAAEGGGAGTSEGISKGISEGAGSGVGAGEGAGSGVGAGEGSGSDAGAGEGSGSDTGAGGGAGSGAESQSARAWASLKAAMERALDSHANMRGVEGDRLVADMHSKLRGLESLLETVESRAPLVPIEYKAKLEARISELLGAQQEVHGGSRLPVAVFSESEAARVAMEVAIIADRCCVDEEIVRLRSHLAQADKTLASGQPMGRKMDFLLQEINREINTIGSKTNDSEIGACVIEMKSEAEKVREQAQNLE